MGGIKGIIGTVAPLAGLIPGIGIPAAAALGAAGGLIGGGGIKGALGGALGAGGLAGGGGALGSFLGAGSGGAGTALGSGLLGAAGGALSGGSAGALTGGALGGVGGYIQGSGGLGNAFKSITGGATGAAAAPAGGLGSSYGLDDYSALEAADQAGTGWLAKGKDLLTGSTTLQPDDYSVLANNTGAALSVPSGNSNLLTPLASAGIGAYSNQKAQSQLLEQQQNAMNTISPFLNSKFDASSLASDPGYQFQLQQGNNAIDRAASSRGNYFSGQALTDAADYSKGLTDTTLNDAYGRYLQDQGLKLGAAGAVNNIYDNIGNVQAGATTNLGNIFTGSLAAATGGKGVNNTGQMVDGSGLSNDVLLSLLRQRGLA